MYLTLAELLGRDTSSCGGGEGKVASGRTLSGPGPWHCEAMQQRLRLLALGLTLMLGACAGQQTTTTPATAAPTTDAPETTAPPETTTAPITAPSTSTSAAVVSSTTTSTEPETESRPSGSPAPDWLGTRLLELRPSDGLGVAIPTPAALVDRQLWTIDHLPPPEGATFVSSVVSPPPTDVLERSTWRPDCPVPVDQLAYGQVSFYGFDGLFHTGEFIVHQDFADGVVAIFEELHATRFPIEEMRVTTQADVDAARTGDANNTSSFVCRNAVSSSNWSRHAFGGAIDINPFHNPFRRGDLILPELASAYLDRTNERPGMVTPQVVALFDEIGWGWGGNWQSLDDWMHFSDTGN